jgi:hypothetical protein
MNGQDHDNVVLASRRIWLRTAAGILVAATGFACFSFAAVAVTHSVTARSGESLRCHHYWRVDAQGKEWPVSLKITSRPSNGQVTVKNESRVVTLRNGQQKTVRVAQVYYQSKKGYVGPDSFTYVRSTADPTDQDNNSAITISVTVK